jgi:hypothetical protein
MFERMTPDQRKAALTEWRQLRDAAEAAPPEKPKERRRLRLK